MRRRNRPSSGGIVWRVAQQVRQRGPIGARRMAALEGLVQLLRVAQEDERSAAGETAITLASDIWPASSTNRTSTDPARSSRAHSQVVPPTTSSSPAASALATSAFEPRQRATDEVQTSFSAPFWPILTRLTRASPPPDPPCPGGGR